MAVARIVSLSQRPRAARQYPWMYLRRPVLLGALALIVASCRPDCGLDGHDYLLDTPIHKRCADVRATVREVLGGRYGRSTGKAPAFDADTDRLLETAWTR